VEPALLTITSANAAGDTGSVATGPDRNRSPEKVAALVFASVVVLAVIDRHRLGFGDFPSWVLAVIAVAVALFGEWPTSVRVADEREHAAKVLADERQAAEARLTRQLEHSAAQL
jgi:hypothetical protein